MRPDEIDGQCEKLEREMGLPVRDGLVHDLGPIVDLMINLMEKR
jgi:hypothetical protein